jgi:hypothetical protein
MRVELGFDNSHCLVDIERLELRITGFTDADYGNVLGYDPESTFWHKPDFPKSIVGIPIGIIAFTNQSGYEFIGKYPHPDRNIQTGSPRPAESPTLRTKKGGAGSHPCDCQPALISVVATFTLGDENCYASRNTSGPRQLARPQGMLRLRDPKRIRCKERTRAVSLLQSRRQLLGIHSRSSLLTQLFPPSGVRMIPRGPRGRSRPRADLSLQRPLPNACEGYAGFNEVVGEMFHHHPSRSCVRRPRAISFSSSSNRQFTCSPK